MIVKTLYIEITNLCNLNCATCYNRSGLNCEREEISAAALEQMIADFLPYGLERVLLSGGVSPSPEERCQSFVSYTAQRLWVTS